MNSFDLDKKCAVLVLVLTRIYLYHTAFQFEAIWLPKEHGALRCAGVMLPRRLEILWRVRSCCIHKDNRFHIAKPSWHRHAVTRGKLLLSVPLG